MSERYSVTQWDGESGTVFYVVDNAAFDFDVVGSHRERKDAERQAATLNMYANMSGPAKRFIMGM